MVREKDVETTKFQPISRGGVAIYMTSPPYNFQVIPAAQFKGGNISSVGPLGKVSGAVNQALTVSQLSKR